MPLFLQSAVKPLIILGNIQLDLIHGALDGLDCAIAGTLPAVKAVISGNLCRSAAGFNIRGDNFLMIIHNLNF